MPTCSRFPLATLLSLVLALAAAACSSTPLYPARPTAQGGPLASDPSPARVVIHLTLSSQGMQAVLDQAVPLAGEGSYALGGQRHYAWRREPLILRFAGGRVEASAHIEATAEVPLLGTQSFPLDLRISGEPVVTSGYHFRLQGASVEVKSASVRLRAAEWLGGVLSTIQSQLLRQMEGLDHDLGGIVLEAYRRIARPLPFKLGEAEGCADLRVTGLEAGPTVLAHGIEKDLAIIVAPSVLLPCPRESRPRPLPPLANVAHLPSGPFVVTVPLVASYRELGRAMSTAFTDGKLFFSTDYPRLYLSKPEVFAAGNQLVLRLRLAGKAKGLSLDGDIYLAGHPTVIDNELSVPDLEPTVETANFLLKLAYSVGGAQIRDKARAALRLDLGERLRAVRGKLSTELGFAAAIGAAFAGAPARGQAGAQVGGATAGASAVATAAATGAQAGAHAGGQGSAGKAVAPVGCLRAEVMKIEVTGIYPHADYLRLYVTATAQAGVYLPCPTAAVAQ